MENKLVELLIKKPEEVCNKASNLIYDLIGYARLNESIIYKLEDNPAFKVVGQGLRDAESSDDDILTKVSLTKKELENSLSIHESVLYDHLVKKPLTDVNVKKTEILKKGKDSLPEHIENYENVLFSVSEEVKRIILKPIGLKTEFIETFSAKNPDPEKPIPITEIMLIWQNYIPLEGSLVALTSKDLEMFCNKWVAEVGLYNTLTEILNNLNIIKNKRNVLKQKPNFYI